MSELFDDLKKLAEMRDKGEITQSEFDKIKAKLVAEMGEVAASNESDAPADTTERETAQPTPTRSRASDAGERLDEKAPGLSRAIPADIPNLLKKRGFWLVVAIIVLAILANLGGSSGGSAPGVAEQGADRWTEDDIEYKLAVVDEGGFVPTDDPVIDRYATALDNAESVCPEGRTMLSDIAVRSVQLLDENVPGHSENALSMLRAITQAAGGNEDLGVECTEIGATIIALIQQG